MDYSAAPSTEKIVPLPRHLEFLDEIRRAPSLRGLCSAECIQRYITEAEMRVREDSSEKYQHKIRLDLWQAYGYPVEYEFKLVGKIITLLTAERAIEGNGNQIRNVAQDLEKRLESLSAEAIPRDLAVKLKNSGEWSNIEYGKKQNIYSCCVSR
jgi:hypothetical protein